MAGQGNAPIIIKRKKITGGDGHHGGAWKVAYADFVTAMMAFFMLMWLLNATTEEQRSGIADYFNPAIPVNQVSGGGDGSFGGDSVFSEQSLSKNGIGASQRHHSSHDKAQGTTGTAQDAERGDGPETEPDLTEIEAMLTGKSGESMVSERLQRHIVTRVTDEGLIVELFDLEGTPLFDGAAARSMLYELVAVVGEVFALVGNEIAIKGHVRSDPIVLRDSPVWDLSTDRAQTVRGMLAPGISRGRIQRIEGFADTRPYDPDPMALRNNRIEMVLLRRD
ncbi:chemotaxis protein MotB [Mesobaculum littorinae]|uniref:Chemotaxis protein MotB n=1 Tax=Mesobaculum littorinae TaxID=2486419 RepID=A0A438AH14_9RHOB|nr:flagellar motor protein MotB [Mesobaculum littorinae]RVV97982.1 chemotaxis protein MotB [Mesobaculum littorinae]